MTDEEAPASSFSAVTDGLRFADESTDRGLVLQLGVKHKNRGDLAGANILFTKAIELRKDFTLAYYYRGFANFDKGNISAALADEDAQLTLRPNSAAGYLDRGAIRLRQGELDQAEVDYNKAIELNPKFAPNYRYRGFLRGSKGDLSGALADYDTSVELDTTEPLAYSGRAVIKIANADLEGALADIQQSIELAHTERNRFYDEVYHWIILAEQNRIAEANQDLTDYLQNRKSRNAEPWMKAIADFLVGKSDETALMAAARSGYNEVATRGQTCEGWFFVGVKRRIAGDREKAADYFAKCVATHQVAFYEYVLANAELKKR